MKHPIYLILSFIMFAACTGLATGSVYGACAALFLIAILAFITGDLLDAIGKIK